MSEEPEYVTRLREQLDHLSRRVTTLSDRRDLLNDRISVLSDRLAGVEHRLDDIRRDVLHELAEFREETESSFRALMDAFVQHVGDTSAHS